MDSQVDALKLEGNAFYSKKNYVAAIRKYSDALELDPTNAVILSNRCAVYLSIQEYEKAVADATWSVHANPSAGNIKAYYRLASAQNKLKNNGISLKTIQEGLRVLGENSDSNGVETSSWALQRSSLIKLQETVKADLKKQRIEQRKQVFFGGNLTECLACSDNSIDGGVCVEECCVNNLYASTQGSGNKLKPKKKKSPTNATVTGPPQPPSSLGTGGALPPAPPNTNKRSACAEEAPVLTATEYDMLSEVKSIMRKVRAGDFAYSKISGGEVDMLAGSFHNLVSGETAFQETLFPGCSSKVRKTLPKNLKELVLWKFDLSGESGGGSNQQQQVQLFNDEVLEYELYPKIYKSAASVLDNLVAKSDVQEAQMRQMQGTQTQSRRSKAIAGAGPGKSEPEPGSIHHPATRSLLVTQITQEAFARELIAYVHAQNRKLSGIKAKTMLNMAVISSQNANTPQARQIANSNHLSERTVSKLNAYAASMDKPVVQQAVKAGDVDLLVSVQDAYMGPEWVELLADDLQRYVADEKMTTVDVNATNAAAPSTRVGAGEVVKMCWVDRDIEGPGGEEASLGVSYPAITELLDNLHSLPYEINRKTNCKLELLEPTRGTTLLTYYPPGTAASHVQTDFQMDSNYLVESISKKVKSDASTLAGASVGSSGSSGRGNSQTEDTGFRLSCTYFVMEPETESESEDAATHAGPPAIFVCKDVFTLLSTVESTRTASQSYDVIDDRLILYPSGRVQHQQRGVAVNIQELSSAATKSRGFFKIQYYIHGRK